MIRSVLLIGVGRFGKNLAMRMSELKKQGKSIIMISEELPELLGMSDRIFIMKDGKFNGEFKRSPELGEKDLIAKMI